MIPPAMAMCFNTAGPCVPGKHYMLSPARRFAHVMRLVGEEKYFTVHAGRQTGKTTAARWLVDRFNEGERYRALWVDIQTAGAQPDPAKSFRTVLNMLQMALRLDWPDAPPLDHERLLKDPSTAVLMALQQLSAAASRPLVVFVDEADGLVGEAMVSFLTQLRTGYLGRSRSPFPHALALIGQRQVRDYALAAEDRRAVAWLGTTSPFNITAEASTLEPFSRDEVAELLDQHTEHTGQRFEPEAVERIFYLSQGHPWLVNAIADQVVNRDVEDRTVAVTGSHVEGAKETIITERRSHIDSLLARLREDRVRRILEPMLVGGKAPDDVLDDDFAYVRGLGLIALRDRVWEIANPIYREVIPRALTFVQQTQMREETSWYVRAGGGLDMPKLMAAWQDFWREDGHLAAEGFTYREAGPHLMLMAFLQRVVNSGGRIEREYGLGRGALDLMIFWQDERHVVEVKLRRDERTLAKGVGQLARYLDGAGLGEGWLVLFDLRKKLGWSKRLFVREVEHEGKRVRVVGC
jgi:type II secretory pathway predicted ATPase ExeA